MESTKTKKQKTEFTLEVKDCVMGMLALPGESVDIVVTSPPYNLGIKYAKYDDNRIRSEYLDWCREWAGEVKRVLVDKRANKSPPAISSRSNLSVTSMIAMSTFFI
jgi:DNA modification methylase